MKKLQRTNRKIDALDRRIVRLFEQRMCAVKDKAEYRRIHDMLPKQKKKKLHTEVVKKTVTLACDKEMIAYTEGLVMYMLSAAEKLFRQTIKRKTRRGGRRSFV